MRLEVPFPCREVCCQVSVVGQDFWDGSTFTGKPSKPLDHDSTRNQMLWAVDFCPKFLLVAWWAHPAAVFESLPSLCLTHSCTVWSCKGNLMILNINLGHLKKTVEVWSLSSSYNKVWHFSMHFCAPNQRTGCQLLNHSRDFKPFAPCREIFQESYNQYLKIFWRYSYLLKDLAG